MELDYENLRGGIGKVFDQYVEAQNSRLPQQVQARGNGGGGDREEDEEEDGFEDDEEEELEVSFASKSEENASTMKDRSFIR